MEKKLEPLAVSTRDGMILIEQDAYGTAEDNGVVVSVDQVPILIKWLEEARVELEQGAAS